MMSDFEEYIRQGEPQKREKGYAWQTAIGMQAVDDLKPSEYLIQTARQHIEGDITIQSATALNNYFPKCNICTLDCTLEEFAVLNFLREQPKATQKEIAAHIGKSERTVKTITVNLTEKGIIERKNGKRNGFWEIKNSQTNR